MTDAGTARNGSAPNGVAQPWFRRGLSLVGILVVGWDAGARIVRHDSPAWAIALLLVSLGAWIVLAALGARFGPVILACVAVMVLAGGLSATATDGVAIVPIIVAVVWLARDIRFSLGWALAVCVVGIALILVGDVVVPLPLLAVVSLAAGVAVAFFGGLSRRQFLMAEARSRALIAEQARADLLASRSRIAHDIHDVLAHSLGGLVIQLDAVDALLDAGDTKAAAARVRDARALAAEGLGEARRAVAALSDVPAEGDVEGSELADALAALLAAHRSLGGTVDFDETGARTTIPAALAGALRRALQESLTNARKHAPGEAVVVRLAWKSGDVTLTVSNPVVAVLPAAESVAPGGGHGLVGMRERFAALPGGSATAADEAGNFVVRVTGRTAERA